MARRQAAFAFWICPRASATRGGLRLAAELGRGGPFPLADPLALERLYGAQVEAGAGLRRLPKRRGLLNGWVNVSYPKYKLASDSKCLTGGQIRPIMTPKGGVMKLITTREAAEALGCSDRTIYAFIKAGRVRSFRQPGKGNQLFVDAAEVELLKKPIPNTSASAQGPQLVMDLDKPKRARPKGKR